MKPIHIPQRITTPLRRLSADTLAECRERLPLSEADRAHVEQMLRHASDVAAEKHSEGRTHNRDGRANFHD